MKRILAQGLQIETSESPVSIQGPLHGIDDLGSLINVLMSFIVPIAGVILFFILIWGGYDILMSRGEPDQLQTGKNKITAGIIGIVLLVLSYLIASILGYIFDLGDGFISQKIL